MREWHDRPPFEWIWQIEEKELIFIFVKKKDFCDIISTDLSAIYILILFIFLTVIPMRRMVFQFLSKQQQLPLFRFTFERIQFKMVSDTGTPKHLACVFPIRAPCSLCSQHFQAMLSTLIACVHMLSCVYTGCPPKWIFWRSWTRMGVCAIQYLRAISSLSGSSI